MTSESGTSWEETPVIRAIEPFETFYRRMYRPLVGLAMALSARREMAEDIAQDALVAAYRSWDRVSRMDDPAAWVRRVVANRSVSLFRRSTSELKALIRLGKPSLNRPDPDLVEAMDLWAIVHRSLSHRQAFAVALRYAEGLNLEEIANVLECSTSTANTHLRRAHERLARELGAEWKEDW